MPDIIWTPTAESDLDDILYYIAVNDRRPETAIRVFEELRKFLQQRIMKQIAGHKHELAPDSWLYFKFKRWLIFYQPTSTGIEVMRVVDGVRDLPNTL